MHLCFIPLNLWIDIISKLYQVDIWSAYLFKMLQGTLWIDSNTYISNFSGLFEIFASELYLDSINVFEGENKFDKSFFLLSASTVSIQNCEFLNISNFKNEILIESVSDSNVVVEDSLFSNISVQALKMF